MISTSTDNGTNPIITVFPDGTIRLYWLENDADIYVHEFDADYNTVVASTLVTGVGTIDPNGLCSVQGVYPNGRIKILLGVVQSGSLVIYESENGVDFF